MKIILKPLGRNPKGILSPWGKENREVTIENLLQLEAKLVQTLTWALEKPGQREVHCWIPGHWRLSSTWTLLQRLHDPDFRSRIETALLTEEPPCGPEPEFASTSTHQE